MARFSERMGFQTIRNTLQVDSVDNALRYSLWNAVDEYYWYSAEKAWRQLGAGQTALGRKALPSLLWRQYFRLPIDDMPELWRDFRVQMKQHFTNCTWYHVYDFIEFLAGIDSIRPYANLRLHFINACNAILERELSAYRFVGDKLIPLTSEQEIQTIETAIAEAAASQPLQPVATHLREAVAALADRTMPNYRNAISESISAVEALCRWIAEDENASLGDALKQIEAKGKVPLHPGLKRAFQQLYGYTSDAEGIRHALKDAPTLAQEDALFMLSTCSAFVNYLIAKANKAGLDLVNKNAGGP